MVCKIVGIDPVGQMVGSVFPSISTSDAEAVKLLPWLRQHFDFISISSHPTDWSVSVGWQDDDKVYADTFAHALYLAVVAVNEASNAKEQP